MKTFEYRLFTNKQQHALLMHCLRESRLIYNEMLEVTKQHYEEQGTFPTKYDLTALFQGHGSEHVPATTVQMLADRLSKSLNRFLARKALAVKVGFPRFKKGSHRRRKAARNVAKTHLKIKRQRRDHHFKVAQPYAQGYQRIVVEDLTIGNMVQNHHLAKSIMDASWGAFLAILAAKAENAGHPAQNILMAGAPPSGAKHSAGSVRLRSPQL